MLNLFLSTGTDIMKCFVIPNERNPKVVPYTKNKDNFYSNAKVTRNFIFYTIFK